jgi:peptidoglycan/LPS O-acetylase OafA/YrhL
VAKKFTRPATVILDRGPRDRFRPLAGLRALAVLLVFCHHLDGSRAPGGFLGVTLFFALSGYLITSLMLAEHAAKGRIDLRSFYIRRVLRLMPALVALVGLTLVASIFLGRGHTLADAWPAIAYLSDIVYPFRHDSGGVYSHTWSLAIEEQFYLLWPGLLILSLRRRWSVRKVVIGVVLGCTLLTILTTMHASPERLADVYRLPYTHLPVMGAGILLAVATTNGLSTTARRILSRSAVAVLALAALLAGSALLQPGTLALYRGGWLALGVLLTALVGHLVVAPRTWLARMLSMRASVWLGRRSYGFYLWQSPVILLLGPHARGSVLLLAVAALVLTLGLTELSWRFVEQPFLKLKSRFEFKPAAAAQKTAGISAP